MRLVPFDSSRLDVRSRRNAERMKRCAVCELPIEYHEQIQVARMDGNGPTIIHRFLQEDCEVDVAYTEVERHINRHIDAEGLCLRSDRRPSKSSSNAKPSKKRSQTSSPSRRK